jgi:hypothetical protein
MDIRLIPLALVALVSLGAGASYAGSDRISACAKGYTPCLPVVADLDCDQIPDSKKPVRVTGSDPYGLDRDRDGLGCEVAGEGGGSRSPWGLILRKPPRKEATSAKVGDTLTVVGWSPRSMKGKRFMLCSGTGGTVNIVLCVDTKKVLTGSLQTLGTWRVKRSIPPERVVKVSLVVSGKYRATDIVPIR